MKGWIKSHNFLFWIWAFFIVLFPILAFAHPGGLGADGCHVCRTNCELYGVTKDEKHCHNSGSTAPAPPPAGSTPPSPSPSSTPTPSSGGLAPSSQSSGGGATPDNLDKISARIVSAEVAVSGGEVFFEGETFGFGGKEIIAQRYFWNFGDGSTALGRNVSHTYLFPGSYHTSLSVSAGEYSATAYKALTIIQSEIFISEAVPGKDSWVEIYNGGPDKIDISGWALEHMGKKFSFPRGTLIGPKSYLVISSETSGIIADLYGKIFLLYYSGKKADEFSYSGILTEDQSFTRIGSDVKITIASPGNGEGKIIAPKIMSPPPAPQKIVQMATNVQNQEEIISTTSPDTTENIEVSTENQTASPFFSNSSVLWLLFAAGIGLLGAIGFITSRRIQ